MVKKWRFWEDIKCAITIGKSSLAHFEIMFSKTILDLFYAKIWPKKTPNKTKLTSFKSCESCHIWRFCKGSYRETWPKIANLPYSHIIIFAPDFRFSDGLILF